MRMRSACLRALRMLWATGPFAVSVSIAAAVVQGTAPYVVIGLGARLIGLAPRLSESADARRAAVTVMVWFAVATVAARAAGVVAELLSTQLGFRLDVAFEAQRMEALAALPGLEHFDSKEHADRLELSVRSQQAPRVALATAGYAVQQSAAAVGSMVILARLGWWAPTLVGLASAPVAISAWRHAGRRVGHSRMMSGEMLRALYHFAVTLRSARELRMFAFIDWLRDCQQTLWRDAVAPHLAEVRHEYLVRCGLSLLKVAALGTPVVVAVQRLGSGSLSVETASAVIVAGITVGPYLHWFETNVGGLREEIAFLPDAFEIAELPEVDPRLDTTGRRRPPAVLSEGFAFHDVAFRYPTEDRWVLHGLQAELPAGVSTALVGHNGTGKSTIVKLLCRMYDPTEGRITLDGVDLRDYDLAELRERFAVLTQGFLRLPVSILENVAVGGAAPTDELDQVRSAMADAGADAVVGRMPEGEATVLAANLGGVELSGGEWQRVALARVLVARRSRSASILVMDEPTAALDVRLEHELFERFAAITEGATTLLISHRFSTVRMAERTMVLVDGRIEEHGTHAELLDAGGTYARLYGLQAARFAEADPA